MSAQLRLSLERPSTYAADAFVVSASNAAAVQALERWPDWRGGALALVGPPGCGKTHLARIWAERNSAALTAPGALDLAPADGAVLVDGADGVSSDEALFHLLNRSAPGASLLLTGLMPPGLWTCRLPDLRSRLNALPVARLEEPNDTVLSAMLRKFFAERNIRPADDLLAYLLRRIERSAIGAAGIVARIDEAADALRRPVTRALAREVLGETGDPPDDDRA